ncbi:transcription initiation factor TFIID subunit 4-like isoform X1 [Neoarius graeffei]|uniref:transcription initiation factor TFIID subunit 4-like isoform X1 n=1 Tax=Neoarius graeffei TaxID=443677 RepID=UPI00298D0A26|nr:transcription initiation factor TFIID subunit 4-like isoform X1 [Neoarius graeffei]
MAGASDPLEDMLFSEVDEKAVSDLVGSLESQLVGRSGNKAGGAKQHLGKALASRANTTSEQQQQHHHHQQQQQQHKAGKERGSESTPAGRAASPESCVKASMSGSLSHSSTSSAKQDGAASPAASVSAAGRRAAAAAAASGSMETARHYGTRKKRGGARGSAASRSVNGAATSSSSSSSVSTNSPSSTGAAAVSIATARANSTTYTVSSASKSVALDKGTPTIALHRLPSHIVASIAQGRNGTSVSALIHQGRVNHGKNFQSGEDKSKADVQPASVNSVPSAVCIAVTQSKPQPQPTSQPQSKPQTPAQTQLQHQSAPQPQTQSQPQPRPAAPPQRITAPQLIVRPPQQQATIQLPPGFTIPPGMVLVRTELGQLMMVPQQALAQAQAQSALSPRPAAPTTTATFRVTTPQSPVSIQTSRAAPAVQNKVVQSQTLSPAPQTCTTSTTTTTTTATTTSTTTATPALTRVPLAVTTPQQHPAALAPQGPTLAPPTAAGPAPGATVISQEMQENVKKCKNFLATLIKLASHNSPSPETSRNVKGLVQDLLDAKIEPEEFTSRLQTELKSSPQPYLVPFLKKSLPALRLSLLNSQQSLTQPLQSKTTISPAGAVTGAVTTGNAPRQPNSTITPSQNIKRTGIIGGQVRMPVVITQTVRAAGAVGKSPVVQAGKSPLAVSVQLSGAQKNKVNDPGGGSFRDDDDINDVASMAGVNLSEESARILATNSELVGTQIRSCKDEAFLPTGLLHRRILETAKKFGVTEVPLEAVNFIAHATQTRLRTVLEKVSFIAQHRLDSSKDEEWHEQSSDVRSQLKFFEHLERLEKQRKDEQEREILLKAAKSRSRQEDPEQARLKQKAKEMQQQELAQIRQRDANLTALAAIGPRKKRKVDSPGATSGAEVSGSSVGSPASSLSSSRQFHRQRITRVNLRDFIFYLEQERETSRSLLLYRALLK